MQINDQIASGLIVSPVTRRPLRLNGKALANDEEAFPVVDGVPVLLADRNRMERYISEGMAAEYSAARPRKPRKPGKSSASEYRKKADAALRAFFDTFSEKDIILSVGGGPVRAHPLVTNLNIGNFPNVDIVADAHELPYADASVAGIYVGAVIEHLHTPHKAVEEMHRVLKPGGRVFSDTPFVFVYHGYPSHYQNLTITGHRLLFERQGFEIAEYGVSNGPAFAMTQMMNHYIRNYLTGFHGWVFKRIWRAMAVLMRRTDRHEAHDAHMLAANTYVVAEKP